MGEQGGMMRAGWARGAALLLGLILALPLPLASQALAEQPPELLKRFGPDGTAATGFEEIGSVAVDQVTHALYVADLKKGSLFKFDKDGNKVTFGGSAPYINENELTGLEFIQGGAGITQVAVDSDTHEIYVTDQKGKSLRAFQADGEAALFSAGPGIGTNEIGGFTELAGVAVDLEGNIYASDRAGVIHIYAASGEPITQFSATEPNNVAVDANGAVYVARRFSSVTKFSPSPGPPITPVTTYQFAPVPIDTGSPTTVGVDPDTNDVYVARFSPTSIARYDEDGNLLSSFAGPGEEGHLFAAPGLAILAIDGATHRHRVFASGIFDSGPDQAEIFIPRREAVPSVVSSVTDVAGTSATLRAEINPNLRETSYHFEYGLTDCALGGCTRVPLTDVSIGSGDQPVSVAHVVVGLSPGTTYHFRVAASNGLGETIIDRTFTTQVSGLGFQLTDRRAWEMVSPPDKHGGRLSGAGQGVLQAAADGNGLVYLSRGSLESEPEGTRPPDESNVLGRRTPAGWTSKDMTPPSTTVGGIPIGDLGEYKAFAPDLSRSLLRPRSATLLSPEASERTPYLRENTEPPRYRPLVTGREGFANVPSGTAFGGSQKKPLGPVAPVGADPDLSHVVLQSEVPLYELHPGESGVINALYQWAAGQLQVVSKLPGSEGGDVVSGDLGGGKTSTRHAVSGDGSRVFWTLFGGFANTRLYVRDTVAQVTSRLDVPLGGSGSGLVHAAFQGASADGRFVFFTDPQDLMPDASPEGEDLYRCEIPLGAPASGCDTLTNLSDPIEGSAEVEGLVSGLSEDGTKAYFVARGVLDEESNAYDESAEKGEPNLYFWREDEGARFVTTLSDEDGAVWGGSDLKLGTAISPSGRYFSFMSERALVGYDNRDAATGESVQEAYLYDAESDSLSCISCNPTGGRPRGEFFSGENLLVDPRAVLMGRWVAAALPEATAATVAGPSFYRPRGALDNGRVFFNAIDALVPADSNGQWDVYQYEPLGVGDCSGSSNGAAVSRSGAGCVSLISSGTAEREAGFVDASESGDDVFFLTSARLSVTDEDGELDVYDARVDGVPATLKPSPECLGEACQPAVVVPNDPIPASAAFNGHGNVKAKGRRHCPKGKRMVRHKGKKRCVAKKHKRKARKHRAGQDGRNHR